MARIALPWQGLVPDLPGNKASCLSPLLSLLRSVVAVAVAHCLCFSALTFRHKQTETTERDGKRKRERGSAISSGISHKRPQAALAGQHNFEFQQYIMYAK